MKRGGTEAAEEVAKKPYTPSDPRSSLLIRGKVLLFSAAPRLRGDILAPVNQCQQSGVAKAPAILLVLALAIFLAGAVRYYRHGSFSLAQAGYCLVAVVASLVVLLVFDYTLHHAKIAALMVLIFIALFMVASPAFCVGMGLALAGMVVQQSREA